MAEEQGEPGAETINPLQHPPTMRPLLTADPKLQGWGKVDSEWGAPPERQRRLGVGGLSYRVKRSRRVGWRPEDRTPTGVSRAPVTTPGTCMKPKREVTRQCNRGAGGDLAGRWAPCS